MINWDGHALEIDGERAYYPRSCYERRRELVSLLVEAEDGLTGIELTVRMYGRHTPLLHQNMSSMVQKVRRDLNKMFPGKKWLHYDYLTKKFHLLGPSCE